MQFIGKYKIIEELGRGGMGIVYRAYDPDLDTDVAVKILRQELLSSENAEKILASFDKEAQQVARLLHPNIIPILDNGKHDGLPYLVMKYMPGGTLQDRLKVKKEPYQWQEAIRIILPIARALQYAHEKGVIHRDVKPGNILFTESGEPVLSDFGIAKILNEDSYTEGSKTQSGIGTIAYMPIEQLRSQNYDHRVDIYSLGCVLYELVTGKKPYSGETEIDLLLNIVNTKLYKPHLYVRTIPADIERIILKCLLKEPNHRFNKMENFISAVDTALLRRMKKEKPKKKIPWGKIAVISGILFGFTICIWIVIFICIWIVIFIRNGPLPQYLQTAVSQVNKTQTPSPSKTIDLEKNPTPQPSSTSPPTIFTPTITSTINLPTLTATPTQIPSPTPTPIKISLSGTPIIQTGKVISTENITSLKKFASWGQGNLYEAVLSPNGEWLVTGYSNGIYIYKTSDFKLFKFIDTELTPVQIAFSSDNTIFAVGLANGNILLFRFGEENYFLRIENHEDSLNDLSFSSDDLQLFSIGTEQTVKTWDVKNGDLIRAIRIMNASRLLSIPNGDVFAYHIDEHKVLIWNINNGSLKYELSHWGVDSLIISPNGELLATDSRDGIVRIWQVSNGNLIRILENFYNGGSGVFSNNSKSFLYLSQNFSYKGIEKINTWRINDGNLISSINLDNFYCGDLHLANSNEALFCTNNYGEITQIIGRDLISVVSRPYRYRTGQVQLSFSADGQYLCDSYIYDGRMIFNPVDLILWEVSNGFSWKPIQQISSLYSFWSHIRLDPNFRVFISENDSHKVYDPETKKIDELDLHGKLFFPSSNGDILGIVSAANILSIIDSNDGTVLSSISGILSPSFSPTGNKFIDWETFTLWDSFDKKAIKNFNPKIAGLFVFSPDGKIIATISDSINIWNSDNGNLVARINLLAPSMQVVEILISPDNSKIAIIYPGIISIWDISNNVEIFNLKREFGNYSVFQNKAAFSPDSKMLIMNEQGGNLCFWDASNGDKTFCITSNTQIIESFAISPDSKLLALATGDNTFQIWGVP